MKFTTFALVVACAAATSQAAPVFSHEPVYVPGSTYNIWIDYGILDTVPSQNLIFAYCPVHELNNPIDPHRCTDIGPAGKTGSPTRQGRTWTPSSDLDGEAKWVLAVHGAEENLASTYWQTGNRSFKIAEVGFTEL